MEIKNIVIAILGVLLIVSVQHIYNLNKKESKEELSKDIMEDMESMKDGEVKFNDKGNIFSIREGKNIYYYFLKENWNVETAVLLKVKIIKSDVY